MKFGFCEIDMDTNSLDMQDYEDPISNKEDQNQAILGTIIEEFKKSTLIDDHGSSYDCIIDPSYHENNNEDVDDDDVSGDASDYDDNDESIFVDDDGENDYLLLQAQLDNDRLPPGVEAPVAGLIHARPSRRVMVQPFGGFSTVDHFPEHHFMDVKLQKPSTKWIKRIQEEWEILNNLPDAIYVKASETRMELMQAVIVGPAGTPYHNGLFIFDIAFPSSYPDIPPMVHYHSGGLRLNPNMYICGKVCLSLLNTWGGDQDEKWKPNGSTMLQLLVSIQALILNSEPFFNEPGNSSRHLGEEGKRKSKHYNQNVFILTLKTMGYTLKNPPKHFEVLIKWHFRVYAHDILSACKSYIDDGIEIGSSVRRNVGDKDVEELYGPSMFLITLCQMMEGLVAKFIENGADDCEMFRLATWQPPMKKSTKTSSSLHENHEAIRNWTARITRPTEESYIKKPSINEKKEGREGKNFQILKIKS